MKISGRAVFRTLALVFLLSAGPAISAESPVGEIVAVEGEAVCIRADGSERPCEIGLKLHGGDRLRTGPDGRVECHLPDGGNLRLGPDSELAADAVAFLTSETEPLVFRLTLGVLRAVFPDSASAPEVHTPTAVIDVRGTAYDVAFALDSETAVAVDAGRVALEARLELRFQALIPLVRKTVAGYRAVRVGGR